MRVGIAALDWAKDIAHGLIAIGIVAAVVTSFMATIALIAVLLTSYECDSYQKQTGVQTTMRAGTCYLHDGTRWMAWSEWKYRQVGKDK